MHDPQLPSTSQSDPPAVKIARLELNQTALILAALSDWIGIISLAALIGMKILASEFAYLIVALSAPSALAKARANMPPTTFGLLLACSPWLQKIVFGGAALLLLSSCTPPAEYPMTARDGLEVINDVCEIAEASSGMDGFGSADRSGDKLDRICDVLFDVVEQCQAIGPACTNTGAGIEDAQGKARSPRGAPTPDRSL